MYRNRITIERYGAPTQNDAGGFITPTPTTWTKWAKVENRSGSFTDTRQQRDWNYDYKITTRYEKTRPERSDDFVLYDGKKLQIREVVRLDENMRREVVLRCSTVE